MDQTQKVIQALTLSPILKGIYIRGKGETRGPKVSSSQFMILKARPGPLTNEIFTDFTHFYI